MLHYRFQRTALSYLISHAESHTKINVRSAGLRFALLDNTSPVISMAHISLHVTLDGSFLDTLVLIIKQSPLISINTRNCRDVNAVRL